MTALAKKDFSYTPYFCEENCWKLGHSLIKLGYEAKKIFVLMLINKQQKVHLNHQKLAQPGHRIVWDYHVILFYEQECSSLIFDFDSDLSFPSQFSKYSVKTFLALAPEIFIRSIPILSYHQHFYSDRSHMLDSVGVPLTVFPNYPSLSNQLGYDKITLQDYLHCSPLNALSDSSIYHLDEFISKYS